MRPSALLPLLLLSVLLLGGCRDPAPGAIRFGLAQAPADLDPRHATDAAGERIGRLLYARLVELDPQGRPVPALAHWQRLSPTHYRFTLGDQGRTFHDGRRLTAADVQATYGYLLDPANASPHRLTLALIERVEAPDSETVDFHLDHPDPLFPAYLALGIVPAAAPAGGGTPVGSGPFELLAWPEEGRLLLRRRDDGQRLEFLTVKDPTVRVLKLLNGELELIQNDLPPELARYLEGREGIVVERRPGSSFTYLGFNLEDPATGDLRVRRAVAHAVDREAILRHLLGGGRLAAALLPPEHWAGHPGLEGYACDRERARALLAEAGYGPGRPLRLSYKTSSDPFRVRLATVIQQQLAEVGVEVELRSNDWGVFFGDIKAGRFQMYSLSWVGIKTPDIFRYVFHSDSLPPKGANRGRYRDPQADRLIDEAAAAADLEGQAHAYRALQERLLAELPYVPLWYEPQVLARRQGVSGYALAADGNYDGLTRIRYREPGP